MENFHHCRTHIPIFSLLIFLHFSSLQWLSLADDYFINCGSDDNMSLTNGQNFVGDLNSGFTFSKKSEGVTDINQLPATISPLYQTARASGQPFYYEFKIDPNSAMKKQSNKLYKNYPGEFDGLVTVTTTDSVAPDLVYQTARVMNITTSRPANSSNITWSFSVSRNAGHIVRAHFCDITGAAPGNIVFNLYSNDNFRKEIGSWNDTISQHPGVPFYYDFMVNSSESEVIKISIRPNMTHATDPNAFLNGLEILEIMEGSIEASLKECMPHLRKDYWMGPKSQLSFCAFTDVFIGVEEEFSKTQS